MDLVLVESPAKAKTINKYLGKNYVVKASLGHIKDLPKRDLAVDVANGFETLAYLLNLARLEADQISKSSSGSATRPAGRQD